MKNHTRISLSIVAPMFNEEGSVDEFISRISKVMSTHEGAVELIVVDDGSTDSTLERLKTHSETLPALQLIELDRNCGQWAAIYAGVQHSQGDYVIVMDSDLQHLPEDIPALLNEAQKGVSLVSGYRSGRKEPLLTRRLPSAIANLLVRKITGCPVRHMGGFKCIEGKMARSLHLRAGQHRLLPALVWLKGGSVSEVEVQSAPRFAGKNSYGLGRTIDVLFDICLLWVQSSGKSRQIYTFGRIALLVFTTCALWFGWVLYEKLVYGIDMGIRPAFFLSLFGMAMSFFILAVGVILEMVSSLGNTMTQQRPYTIKNTYP